MDRDALHEATAAEVAAGLRRTLWAHRWMRWTRWWARRASELKTAAVVAGSVGAIYGSVKLVLWRESPHDVGAPAEQIGGSERMGIDRVTKPSTKD